MRMRTQDFLFVPVHEQRASGHWALAVICFPGAVVEWNAPAEASPKAEVKAEIKEDFKEGADEAEVKAEVKVDAPMEDAPIAGGTAEPTAASAGEVSAVSSSAGAADRSTPGEAAEAVSLVASAAAKAVTKAKAKAKAEAALPPADHDGKGAPCMLFADSSLANENKARTLASCPEPSHLTAARRCQTAANSPSCDPGVADPP